MFKLNKRIIRLFTAATLLLGVLSLLWLVYDYTLYRHLKPVILNFGELGRLEQLAEFVWLSYLFMFMTHIVAGVTLLLHIKVFQSYPHNQYCDRNTGGHLLSGGFQ